MKKYATMTNSGASVVSAKNKKEAASKLKVKESHVYRYDK